MKIPALPPDELALLRQVFQRHPEITSVKLFGSRAKGTHSPRSDVDLAVWGEINALQAETLSLDLDELPLPYHYDVTPFRLIQLDSLREHIQRVGLQIYSKD